MENCHHKDFSNFHKWIIVLTAALCFYFNLIQVTICNTLGSYLTTALNIKSPVTLGYFTAVYLYATIIFLFPAGIIVDKFSLKKIAAFFIAVSAISNICLAFTSSLQNAFIVRFTAGIAGSFSFLVCLKLAPMWFSTKKLGSVIGVCATIGMCGGLTSQLPLQWLLNNFGGKNVLLITGGIGLTIFILVILLVNDHPSIQKPKIFSKTEKLPFIEILSKTFLSRQTWCASLYIGLVNLPLMILGAAWGVKYLSYTKGITSDAAASLTGIIFLGAIFGMSFFGWFSDKLKSRKLPMYIGAFIALVITSTVIFINSSSLFWLIPAFFILGFITSSQVIGYPVVTESCYPEVVGSANALCNIIIFAVAAVMQPFFGFLIAFFSAEKTISESYTLAMLALPLCLILSILLTACLKESFKK